MIKLYHAPLTRSLRILWLLEELGLPYELANVTFLPPTVPYSQDTPSGKLPCIQDGDLTLFESGAILEYIIDRYGNGRLAPPPGTPERGTFLQWVHFSEATAFPALAQIAYHTLFKPEAERVPAVAEDGRRNAALTLQKLERALAGKDYILGRELSGADIMLGYTLLVSQMLGVLTDAYPNTMAYYGRLNARPALQKALAQS
jgi:glutathione S-transferase